MSSALLTRKEVAAHLRVSIRTVDYLVAKGRLKSIRLPSGTADRGMTRFRAATLRLRAGDHPKVVSEMLGHSSIQITMDLYTDSIPTLQRECADRFDAIL